MAINISQLVAEFGAYYKAKGQNVKDIRGQLMSVNETDRLFQLNPTNDTRLEGGTIDIGPVLQAYQDTFTKYGDVSLAGVVIDLYQLKVDLEKNPNSLERSWAGFLASNKLKRSEWPIVRYLIEKLVIPKIQEDWELNGVFKGAPTAITPGTAHPIINSVKGIKKLQNDAVTAAKLSPIVLGSVPTDIVQMVDYVEAFVDSIPKEALPFLQDIAMSDTLFKRFRKGMCKKYNMNYAQMELTKIAHTNVTVSGFRSHEGSNRIWTTIQGNAVMGVKKPENEQVFNVEESKRQLSIMTDFYKGLGFWRYDCVWINDVELPS